MASKAIPCRTCGQFPAGAAPKTWTAAEVGDMVVAARICAHDDCANDAIAAVRDGCKVAQIGECGPCKHCLEAEAAIREKTGVKE